MKWFSVFRCKIIKVFIYKRIIFNKMTYYFLIETFILQITVILQKVTHLNKYFIRFFVINWNNGFSKKNRFKKCTFREFCYYINNCIELKQSKNHQKK